LFVVRKRHEQRASRTERKDRQTEKKKAGTSKIRE
jgi:hypothetical protein